jgi:RNA polymerase sigma-70 factor, ECF subfamily
MLSQNTSSRYPVSCAPESSLTSARGGQSPIPAKSAQPTRCATFLDCLRSGHEHAYEELVRQFSGRLLAIARRYLRSEEDAADTVQNAFICAFKSIETFNGDSQLSTWLHRIVVNCALMQLRANRRRGEKDKVRIDDLLPRFDTTGEWIEQGLVSAPTHLSVEASETRAIVRQCIELLPENYRTVLILRDIDEFDTEEAAELLNLTISTVKVRLHRARQALKILLERRVGFVTR